MIKIKFILILLIRSTFGFSQTKNENLNFQLGEMKKFFLVGEYESFVNFVYPKVIEMAGGKSNLVKITEQSINKIKNDGFSYIDLSYKDVSEFLKKGNELQCSIIQVIIMNTPRGKIEAEYTLIGISSDDGRNWTFIDTSGKDKETMLQYFPNLHNEIVIKPKKQKSIY